MTDLKYKEIEKFFIIKEPIKCVSENTPLGTKLIVNDKYIIEPLNMTWPNIRKEICYDPNSNEWFEK